MKKTTRCLSLALCLLMALTIVPAVAEDAHGPLWIGDYELTFWTPIESTAAQYYETLAEHPYFQWMEEQTGVHVEFIHPSYEQMEQQLNLMITTGNYYDIMREASYPDGPQAAINDGVFADIEQFRDLMPNYFAAIECNDGTFADWEWGPEKELLWAGVQPAFKPALTTVEGNVWCVSQVWCDALPTDCGAYIRQDWLDEAGLDMPETLEDLEKVLAALKARGEDVIPMSLGNYGYNGSYYIMNAFDINMNWYYVQNNEVKLCFNQPGLKDYLTLMADWYAKGYIDPDFMNRDDESLQALFLSDRLGILMTSWSTQDYYEGLYTGTQNFKLSPMSAPVKEKGQQLHMRPGYDSSSCSYALISAHSDKKEIAARWLDVFYSKEGILRGQYGVEGESYVMVDGHPYFTEWTFDHLDEDNLYHTYFAPNQNNYWSTRASLLINGKNRTVEDQQTKTSDYQHATAVWGDHADFSDSIGFVSFAGDGWAQMFDPYTEAETYFAPMILRFITGKEPIEKFDEYSQKAMDMGFAEARDKMQEAYNTQHGLPEGTGISK